MIIHSMPYYFCIVNLSIGQYVSQIFTIGPNFLFLQYIFDQDL